MNKSSNTLQALNVSHNDQFRVESDALFSEVASTSHAIFGNFVLNHRASQQEETENAN